MIDLEYSEGKFVAEYLKNGGNATEAYLTVHPDVTRESASVLAARLLRKVKVQQVIEKAQQEAMEAALASVRVTRERVLAEVAAIAFARMDWFYNEDGSLKAIHELNDEAKAVLMSTKQRVIEASEEGPEGGITTVMLKEIKLYDKGPRLRDLMEHLGMFEANNRQMGAAIALAFKVSPKDTDAA